MPDRALVARVLGGAWRRDSPVPGERHRWCVAAFTRALHADGAR
ncbi:hypothetical protein Gocc_1264 [Gaiella occulta]|uniref:Uncharacterized protein n=1 Tax=Gaiella occulta TaxID=1002870 RepID=A0A7M2YZD7_9ACTN|nr:hypothetical protein [Gaiella occulta]RDI75466.1 hypothetical protein Gocc_1264 [Gaiella occulta]